MTNEHASAACQQYAYDKEWIELIMQAKQIGLSTQEVSNFLKQINEVAARP